MSEARSILGVAKVVRKPLALAAVNFAAWSALSSVSATTVAQPLFNLIRIALMTWAGWLAMRYGLGLMGAAQAAIAVLLVDHLVLKGGTFLVHHALGHSSVDVPYLMAFLGVVISFVLFSPLAAAFGVCGGLLQRRWHEGSPA
jgi:hypothetical protein